MKLLDLVHPKAIVADLAATDRNAAIRELVRVLAEAGCLPAEAVDGAAKSIIARERTRGTTGFGKGVAAPHAKVESIERVVAAVGRSVNGIDFSALDGELVFGIFLIISPADQPEQHLRAMDLVFRNLQQERFRKFLRQSDSAEKIYDLLREADEKHLSS
ncbi:MAG: PTS sugar transporter subunit IIA [Planctomycetota bacterium]|nr:MAG: PTS sugar transporter subunit IIA [Planctomycetota bacterium]